MICMIVLFNFLGHWNHCSALQRSFWCPKLLPENEVEIRQNKLCLKAGSYQLLTEVKENYIGINFLNNNNCFSMFVSKFPCQLYLVYKFCWWAFGLPCWSNWMQRELEDPLAIYQQHLEVGNICCMQNVDWKITCLTIFFLNYLHHENGCIGT